MKQGKGSYFKALIGRCLDGDEESWENLVEAVTPVIFSVCQKMRQSQEESVDIFGQVCYLLLENLSQLKSPEKFLSYTASIARHQVLATVRRGKLLQTYQDNEQREEQHVSEPGPDELVEESERREILIAALLRLPPRESKLMWRLFLDESEPSYEEISRELDIPVASIGPTRARCLAKLTRWLKKTGFVF